MFGDITRSWFFSDIQTGDVFWVSSDRNHPHHAKCQFGPLNEDGVSRNFDCLNGAWRGTLTEKDEGAMELHVHFTGTRHFVYLCEKVERPAPIAQENPEDSIPF